MDDLTNLATGVVALAPVPAASGTTLMVGPGQGARFPAPPFNATIWPARYVADPENAEIVRVTAVAGDVLTVVRAQEGTDPVFIQQGYRFDATPTLKWFMDLAADVGEAALAASTSAQSTANAAGAEAAAANTALAALPSTYAALVSPALAGTPTAPTATTGTSTTQVATTAFVAAAVAAVPTGPGGYDGGTF